MYDVQIYAQFCTAAAVPEFIDPVFTKTSPKRSFSHNRKRAFWLVFAKTGSIISGTDIFDMLRTVCQICRSTWERNYFYWLSLSKKLFKGCLNDIINELFSACTLIFFGFTYQSQVIICVRLSFWINFTPSTLSFHYKILKSSIWSLV